MFKIKTTKMQFGWNRNNINAINVFNHNNTNSTSMWKYVCKREWKYKHQKYKRKKTNTNNAHWLKSESHNKFTLHKSNRHRCTAMLSIFSQNFFIFRILLLDKKQENENMYFAAWGQNGGKINIDFWWKPGFGFA